MSELQAIGPAFDLPHDPQGLRDLAAKYRNDDNLVDQDMDVQTYAQLSLAAQVDTEQHRPLWIAK